MEGASDDYTDVVGSAVGLLSSLFVVTKMIPTIAAAAAAAARILKFAAEVRRLRAKADARPSRRALHLLQQQRRDD